MRVRVKICGIQDRDTAHFCAQSGVDALGFVFASSKRQVTIKQVKNITQGLPPFVAKVGVFQNQPLERVNEIANECDLDWVQLHGEESIEYAAGVCRPVLKAIAIEEKKDLDLVDTYQDFPVLIDRRVGQNTGGTGQSFPWKWLAEESIQQPYFVAGGLTPENIAQAIREAKPYGVDVSGGVETEGIKDQQKISEFLNNVKKATDG